MNIVSGEVSRYWKHQKVELSYYSAYNYINLKELAEHIVLGKSGKGNPMV